MSIYKKIIYTCFLSFLFITPAEFSFAQNTKLSTWQQTNFSEALIDINNVVSICDKDHIQSIETPSFMPASEEKYVPKSEPVISLNINGVARAYPLRFLLWHEVVNDTIGGVPVAITYSPFSNTSIVFDRTLNNEVLDFGVSGELYFSNTLLYDKKTESWWQQYTGQAVAGQMKGNNLQVINSRVESFAVFKKRFPKGQILMPYDFTKPYGTTPYPVYDSFFPFLYKGSAYAGKLSPMTYVVVAEGKAWPLDFIMNYGKIEADDLRIAWTPVQNSVLDAAEILLGKDLGNIGVQKKTDSGEYVDIPYKITFAFVYDAFEHGTIHGE